MKTDNVSTEVIEISRRTEFVASAETKDDQVTESSTPPAWRFLRQKAVPLPPKELDAPRKGARATADTSPLSLPSTESPATR